MTGPGAIHGIATANLGCEAGARVACEGGRSLVPSVCLEGMPMLADFCGKFGEFPKLDQPCIIYIYIYRCSRWILKGYVDSLISYLYLPKPCSL